VQINEPAFRANDYLLSGSVGLFGLLSQAVMVAFLVFFILDSGDLFKRKLVRLIGTKLSEKRITLEAIHEINAQIERFLLIQVLTSTLVGLCTTAALWWFGVHQPAVWGLAAGIFNSIPCFGAIIVTAGLALVAFLQFGSLTATLQVSGVALAITSLEGFLLTPSLMGRAARINGVAMFLSLLF
jgi:predicted PurR-regulated permease PerM